MSVASAPTATMSTATMSAANVSTAGFDYAEDNAVSSTAPRRRFSAYVRAAPPLEPPYDPPEAPGRPHLRVVGGRLAEPQPFEEQPPFEEQLPFDQPSARQSTLGDDFWGPQPTARRALPDPQPLAHRFLQATLEALAGWRSTAQLQQWTSPTLYADLTRARRVPQPRRSAAPTVTSVHVSEPADGVAEVAAVIRRGARFHAVAARLEGVDGQWRCVSLQIG